MKRGEYDQDEVSAVIAEPQRNGTISYRVVFEGRLQGPSWNAAGPARGFLAALNKGTRNEEF